MRGLALLLATVVACYEGPTTDPLCGIACTDTCPGDMLCKFGRCSAAGESCVPTFSEVHPGNGFACALDDRRALWCWGDNRHHEVDPTDHLVVPIATRVDPQPWDQISTGGGHVCGLRAGVLLCWGRNDHTQVSPTAVQDIATPTVIDSPTHELWSAVSAGYDDTCGIAGGKLYCWGSNTNGQLGVGPMPDRAFPTPVMTATNTNDWSAVVAGFRHTCAISPSGLYCWGLNASGQLGDGTGMDRNIPVQVMGFPGTVTSIALGFTMTCAINDATELYCWGSNSNGQLGDPSVVPAATASSSTPLKATNLVGWTQVGSSEVASCALRDGEVWCWGRSVLGGHADGLWFQNAVWIRIAEGVSSIGIGINANLDANTPPADNVDLDLGCFVKNGAVACWGDNRFGELAQNAFTEHPTPIEVAGNHTFSSITAGTDHVCAIEGTNLACWGATTTSQIEGIESGTTTPCGSSPTLACDVPAPKQLAFGTNVEQVVTGLRHSCIRAATTVTCWGDDSSNQTGSPNLTMTLPNPVTGHYDTLFANRARGQCAIESGTGLTWCWGIARLAFTRTVEDPHHELAFDGIAQLQLGTSSGGDFGCFLDATKQLQCYGNASYYQFGNNAMPAGDQPITPLGRFYDSVSVGWASGTTPFACGVRTDKTIECWGSNAFGQCGETATVLQVMTPFAVPGISDCTALGTGSTHACAVCGGDLWCWGDNRRGQIGSEPVSSMPVTQPRKVDVTLAAGDTWQQVSAGSTFTCGLTTQGHAYCWGLATHGGLGIGASSSNLPLPIQLAP